MKRNWPSWTLLFVFWAVIIVLVSLSGCSTMNRYGIGGEPLLMCKYRDGTAHLDDKIAGSDNVRASINRRFTDGDALCRVK